MIQTRTAVSGFFISVPEIQQEEPLKMIHLSSIQKIFKSGLQIIKLKSETGILYFFV